MSDPQQSAGNLWVGEMKATVGSAECVSRTFVGAGGGFTPPLVVET